MKFVSFEKYKAYLESHGYTLEKGKNDYSQTLGFITYIFSKHTDEDKYFVNVFTDRNGNGDSVMSINYGHGSIYTGHIKKVKIDFRTNYWNQFVKLKF